MINVLVTRLQHRPLINNHSHFPSLSLSETGFTFFSLILGSKNDNVCVRKVPKFVESGKKSAASGNACPTSTVRTAGQQAAIRAV